MTPQVSLGQLLRYYRKNYELTQADLAEKLGYTYSFISRVEQGERLPSRDYLEAFSAVLELSDEARQQLLALYSQNRVHQSQLALEEAISQPAPSVLSTWSDLRHLCADITQRRLLTTAKHKYYPELYLPRGQLHRAFTDFLVSDRACFVLSGPSGVGKSNFLLALTEELISNESYCILMYNAASLPKTTTFTELVSQDLHSGLSGSDWTGSEVWTELAQNQSLMKGQILLGLDALNEYPCPEDLLHQLDSLLQSSWPWLKVVITCRPETWQTLRRNVSLAETRYYQTPETFGIELLPFSNSELPLVYTKYHQVFNLQTSYKALSSEARDILCDPLSLFLIASSYEQQELPTTLKAAELIDLYVRGLLRSGRLVEADLAWLEQKVVPEMLQAGRYSNTISLAYLEAAGDGQWTNHPALINLLNSGLLVKQGESLKLKISFKHERFYDYFLSKQLRILAKEGQFEIYLNILRQLPSSLFLWGALQAALLAELQQGRMEIIIHLVRQLLPLTEEVLANVLIVFAAENPQAVERLLQAMGNSPDPQVKITALAVAGRLAYQPILIQAATDPNPGVRLAALRAAHLLWRRQPVSGQQILTVWADQMKWRLRPPFIRFEVIEPCLGLTILMLTDSHQNSEQTHSTQQFLQKIWRTLFARIFFIKKTKPGNLPQKLLQQFVFKRLRHKLLQMLGRNFGPFLAAFFPIPAERQETFFKLLHCLDLTYEELLREEDVLIEALQWNDKVTVYLIDTILLMKLPRHGDQGLRLVERLFRRILRPERPLHSSGHLITTLFALLNREPDSITDEAFTIYRDLVTENFDQTWGIYYTHNNQVRVQLGISGFSVVEWQKYRLPQPTLQQYALKKTLLDQPSFRHKVLEGLVWDSLWVTSMMGQTHLALATAKFILEHYSIWQDDIHFAHIVANGLAGLRLYAPQEMEIFFEHNSVPHPIKELAQNREMTTESWLLRMLFPKAIIFIASAVSQPGPVRETVVQLLKGIPTCATVEQWLELALSEMIDLLFLKR